MEYSINQNLALVWMPVFLFWFLAAVTSKRNTESHSGGQASITNLIVGVAWWLLFTHGFGHTPLRTPFLPMTIATLVVGWVLTLVGLGFAVWARLAIGRNWSPVVNIKENHLLIRKGPYALVRHPIYSGFMCATLGSAVAFNELSGLFAFVMIVVAWGYKAKIEEGAMEQQFGAEYDQYRHEVKGLVPFVW